MGKNKSFFSLSREKSRTLSMLCDITDLDKDGQTNSNDIVILANRWLQSPTGSSTDIVPRPDGDGIVGVLDFSELVEHWFELYYKRNRQSRKQAPKTTLAFSHKGTTNF